jgi:predicted nucleic acid-binding protein
MGLTVLDAGVLIGFLDGRDAHHAGAHRLLTASLAANDTLALPASALAEVLVGPSRRSTPRRRPLPRVSGLRTARSVCLMRS